MPDKTVHEIDFLERLSSVVEERMSDERFGVSELAEEMHMSRSNLLRKVKKETKLSVSQIINQLRLKRAMELLRTTSLNVTEVGRQVGFGGSSYFIKCFREYYGYPPGEVGKRGTEPDPIPTPEKRPGYWLPVIVGSIILLISALIYFVGMPLMSADPEPREKSIAVLPFKNDSNDSSNIYIINGIMESTLNHLQKIKELRVISRTSTEKYRNAAKTIPEMSEELNVTYFVEGSGQKVGDHILLNIQLIDAVNDRHLWAKQYRSAAGDIFSLQQEIAKDITDEIQVIITPEEKKRIEKNPTSNLVAYDFYLKARDFAHKGHKADREEAIKLFKQAIEHDPKFSLAYAEAAIVYYFLDLYQQDKQYQDDMSEFADKALLHDPKLAESLIAKSLVYIQRKQYELALPYLEKALEYNPNAGFVIAILSDFHNNLIPNTAKYLEYALMGTRIGFDAADSTTTSYNYLRLADALLQSGFIDESIKYVNASLDYSPENYFSRWVKIFALFARDRNAADAKKRLIKELERDTATLIMLEELGKMHYLTRDFPEAYTYYKKFLALREAQKLEIFNHESLKIAIVFQKMGYAEQAEEFLAVYKAFADNDRSIYKDLHFAAYHAYRNESEEAIRYLKAFAEKENFQYWILLMRNDPGMDNIRNHPEYEKVIDAIEEKFWRTHKKMRQTLEEKGLI